MAETKNGGADQPPNTIDHVPPMSFWEKCWLWLFSAGWTLMAAAFLLPSMYCLIALSVVVLFHLRNFFAQSAQWKIFEAEFVGLLAANFVVSGLLLLYPVSVFRKMARRKKATGSIYPSGEELIAWRWKQENPSLGTKLAVVGVFVWIAVGVTHGIVTDPTHHVLINWGWPALFWILAAIVAIKFFIPRPERIWTDFAAAGVFAALAILYAIGLMHSRTAKPASWIFPLLTASLSGGIVAETIRSKRRQRFLTHSVERPAEK